MFRSDDPAVQGYFDLSGLEIPDGYSSVVYELSVEPVNALYVDSTSVGPYRIDPVTMSGTASPIRLTIQRGGEVMQDVTVQGGPNEPQDEYEPNTFASPAMVPSGGDWVASISGYGDIDYAYFNARGNRTFTFDVIAIDASGHPVTTKVEPVTAVWRPVVDPEDGPLYAPYFNSNQAATTRIQAEASGDGLYKLGVVRCSRRWTPRFPVRSTTDVCGFSIARTGERAGRHSSHRHWHWAVWNVAGANWKRLIFGDIQRSESSYVCFACFAGWDI
jgi:hypothetical protein